MEEISVRISFPSKPLKAQESEGKGKKIEGQKYSPLKKWILESYQHKRLNPESKSKIQIIIKKNVN